MRVLIAGVGNVLHGDDGFGVEVVRTMQRGEVPDGVVLTETGIGGIALVQDLMPASTPASSWTPSIVAARRAR